MTHLGVCRFCGGPIEYSAAGPAWHWACVQEFDRRHHRAQIALSGLLAVQGLGILAILLKLMEVW